MTRPDHQRFWSPVVHELSPYVPGEQPQIEGLIKLNTNEHPLGPSPRVLEAIRRETGESLRLYPDPQALALKRALAGLHGLAPDQIFVGNGSDEVLAHAFLGLFGHGRPVLFPDITYSFYPVYCGLYRIAHERVPLDADFSVRIDDFRRPNGGIVIANPNAPTGRLLPLSAIERLLQANPDSVVLIDEAYIDFGGESAVSLIARFPQLLVVRTFSKSRALAGLRVGYAMGQAGLIEALERVKDSFNSYPLDRIAIAAATASVEDSAWFAQSCAAVIAEREAMSERLRARGFQVLPSGANFVFARHPGHAGAALQRALRERKVLVRHFSASRIADFLRITVGTTEQGRMLDEALADILG
ncbi:MAG: histidinol-phosphate transaminase [Betaproteobacteria bacterium]|nr:histidinol-phosphate transaminase [Betaproteobacteria bacterium]